MSSRINRLARPGSTIYKGGACTNCRIRKIKCDGARPSCNACLRSSEQFQDCEYTNGGSTPSQMLEEQIAVLEARLQQLQQQGPAGRQSSVPTEASGGVALHNPYQAQPINTVSSSSSETPFQDQIPAALRNQLFRIFISHAPHIGFFLNIDRFANSALNVPATERGINALLNTAYLWAVCLSSPTQNPDLKQYEAPFLKRALEAITQGLSGTMSPGMEVSRATNVLCMIQASCLIARYFFHNVKILEGKYHMTTAMSLAISAGLHAIRSSELSSNTILPQPVDVIEEGERINAFWAVLTLNYCWTAIDGSPSNVMLSAREGLRIDTPWPEDMEAYSSAGVQTIGSHTVLRFLTDTSGTYDAASPTSWPTLNAKAAILFEQATQVGSKHWDNMISRSPNTARSSMEFSTLDSILVRFIQSTTNVGNHVPKKLLVTQCLAHAAYIRLHRPFVDQQVQSRQKVVDSATAAVRIMQKISDIEDTEMLDPIAGPIWMVVFQALVDELKKLKTSPSWMGVTETEGLLRDVVQAMNKPAGASGCGMMSVQASRAGQVLAELQG
ncbi:hypothetical protein VNI00_017495 [Paramarasmius palmivorus]|uniref:Zn(2)-C6 fungal-type domain-containing protein n=1 Tax=Paramarasmius palmivorus TaxID=297713 RepID=A0AAW0B5P6_9AGAR